ncbi:hypothetical protein [Roseovarius salinarum]|uniref:hypothetical protein n=1 Tax=Roseovarius salinarum TaxID=1981892 RepID=UPI000C32C7E0|nr:hypothetical protein [Roseovarius salinarum]
MTGDGGPTPPAGPVLALVGGMLMAGAGAAISSLAAVAGLVVALAGAALCALGAWRLLRR